MSHKLTLSFSLAAQDLDVEKLYELVDAGIKCNQRRLDAAHASGDYKQYNKLGQQILEGERFLSLIRIDTLTAMRAVSHEALN